MQNEQETMHPFLRPHQDESTLPGATCASFAATRRSLSSLSTVGSAVPLVRVGRPHSGSFGGMGHGSKMVKNQKSTWLVDIGTFWWIVFCSITRPGDDDHP